MKEQLERVIGAPADDNTQLAWSSQLALDRRRTDTAKQKMCQMTVAAARDAMQLQLVSEQRCNGAAVQGAAVLERRNDETEQCSTARERRDGVSEVMSACPGKGPRHIKLERSASSLWAESFSAVWGPFSYNSLLRGVKNR